MYYNLKNNIEINNIKAFLFKTADNLIKQKYRDIKKREEIISLDSICDITGEDTEDMFGYTETELREIIQSVISLLTVDELKLLKETKKGSSFYKTTKELASEYGCSETNIRQRIFVLRKKIKKYIKKRMDFQ